MSEYAPDGFTPVALAAFFGQPAAVKALIAAGADVNAAAKNGLKVAALHAAVAGGKLDIVQASSKRAPIRTRNSRPAFGRFMKPARKRIARLRSC